MRVLLVEDDKETARSIECMLQKCNAICHSIGYGSEALQVGSLYEYDIIILDLNLPDINGQEIIKRLRSSRVPTPVLVISSDQNVKDRVDALGFGADDFLVKPFYEDELYARLQAVVRRSQGHADPIIHVGDLSISLRERLAYAHGKKLDLTGKEYRILELLALKQGSTITKETFLNYLYGGLDEPECKIVDVFVCKLRKKLKMVLGDSTVYIETVWGRGYVLRNPAMPFSSDYSMNTLNEYKKTAAHKSTAFDASSSEISTGTGEAFGSGGTPPASVYEYKTSYGDSSGMIKKNNEETVRRSTQAFHIKKPLEEMIPSSKIADAAH
jgi:two-component system cell cycle response regulator CtrA